MRTVLLLLLASGARAFETTAECPSGTHRVSTTNPYTPFECVKEDAKKGFGTVKGPQGFLARPRCPRGTRAEASNDGLQAYRCVRVKAGEAEPELTPDSVKTPGLSVEGTNQALPQGRGCPPGRTMTRTNDPLEPYQCLNQAGPRKLTADSYRRYTVPAEMSFDYPRQLQPRDGWKEEVPTLSFTLDDGGSPGKPVMITITRVEPSQPNFIGVESAVNKDKEWQNAQDGPAATVAGVRARTTFVAGESKTAYIPLAGGAYYTVVYSAPVESYAAYLPAYDRLLHSLKLTRRGK